MIPILEAARRVSQKLKKSADDDKFIEELEEFFKIMDTNEVDC
jgi:hypothetical protein